MLSDGSTVVESPTTAKEDEEYYVQIQGSDRKYPAIVLRRKHRGVGATILTVSKNGQHSDLYADYEEAISQYNTERGKRRDNTFTTVDNSGNNGENQTTRDVGEGGIEDPVERWIDQAVRGANRGPDNGSENPL